MAQYTMELRTIIENGYNIFDFPYQFYDEEQRLKFQEHFIKHFYFREIGCDTIDRFKWYLEDKFNLNGSECILPNKIQEDLWKE